MRSRRPLVSAVLAAALLLGQWLAATHGPDHDHALQAVAAHTCALCAYVHGAGAGVLPAIATLNIHGALEAPETAAAGNPLAATLRHHPIRGPPALLA
jgi:hypothetical protein